MSTARFLIGDSLTVLRTLPDASVDLVLTSPAFLALRSYLPADHPQKPLEMGSEATPGEFIDNLLDVVEACRRVLAPHGSICVELGDTYGGHDNRGSGVDAGRHDAKTRSPMTGPGWPADKSLCMIPELFRIALAYGRNPLTGRQTPQWRVRNVVRWCRPNPPVGALADKFRPATSEMVVATIARDRYFDLDAVRTPYSENSHARTPSGVGRKPRTAKTAPDGNRDTLADLNNDGAGAPPLDWWKIPTQPYDGAHYATWPEQLCVIPIKAMCPTRVCTACGSPSRRIIDRLNATGTGMRINRQPGNKRSTTGTDQPDVAITHTVGWTDCGHDTWRPGVVLDPFAGSGTTLAVATGHGRDAIGIDLDGRNAHLAEERVGMWLTVEDTRIATGGAA